MREERRSTSENRPCFWQFRPVDKAILTGQKRKTGGKQLFIYACFPSVIGKGKPEKRERHARREEEAKKEKIRKKAYIEKFCKIRGGEEDGGGKKGREA